MEHRNIMPLIREFIGWQSALPTIIDRLLADFQTHPTFATSPNLDSRSHRAPGEIDLSNDLLVVPSARARQRLLEILVDRCQAESAALNPPTIVTVGQLPEFLYQLKKPFANDLTQRMAWTHAIQQIDADRLLTVFGHLPESKDDPDWLQMAELINRLHRELASDVLLFHDVLEVAKDIDGFTERDRWEVLQEIQRNYFSILDEAELWDRQTARSFAIQHDQCRTTRQIYLIGTVDINQSLRRMIAQIAARPETPPIKAYILADKTLADHFDEFGCLNSERWQEAQIEIDNQQVVVADQPLDQASTVTNYLHRLESKYRADQITIALPQQELEPFLHRKMSQHGLSVRFARGTPLSRSGPYRLLSSVADFLRTNRFEQMAALLRHPDLHAAMLERRQGEDYLTFLDRYQNQKLPTRIKDNFVLSNDEATLAVAHVYELLLDLIDPLAGDKKQKLTDWQLPVEKFLQQVYRGRTFDEDQPHDRLTLESLRNMTDAFAEFKLVPEQLLPALSATQLISLVLKHLQGGAVSPERNAEAIEAIGWLDLPLDDAPVAVILGFNDGTIPSTESSDLFLPNSIRERLDLSNDSRRYARDAYALNYVLRSREQVLLIAGRRDAQNYPLIPSRLLFATDEVTIAQRAQAFFQHQSETAPEDAASKTPSQNTAIVSGFTVPLPDPSQLVINKLSPTGFRTYLKCPYRFYLQRILGYERELEDRMQELDASEFGNILHWVVEEFGNSDLRDSADAREIRDYFRSAIKRIEKGRFNHPVKPAVHLQLENLRLRLDKFAEKQAEWRAAGWQIRYIEKSDLEYEMIVDGQPFTINGRVDRVDVHEQTGVIFVFDYKSSDVAKTPDKAHYKNHEWIDLQLPLYRHLVKQLPFQGDTRLGYISIPRALNGIGFFDAGWSEQELLEADRVAADVIRNLRNGVYWPPTDPPPLFSEEFAAICMDGVFDRPKLQTIDHLIEAAS
jgi:hypothetical protein